MNQRKNLDSAKGFPFPDMLYQRKSLAHVNPYIKEELSEFTADDDEVRRLSLANGENYVPKRRYTYAEYYIKNKRTGSLQVSSKFYTDSQRKGTIQKKYLNP